jgi:hypothetical protein
VSAAHPARGGPFGRVANVGARERNPARAEGGTGRTDGMVHHGSRRRGESGRMQPAGSGFLGVYQFANVAAEQAELIRQVRHWCRRLLGLRRVCGATIFFGESGQLIRSDTRHGAESCDNWPTGHL